MEKTPSKLHKNVVNYIGPDSMTRWVMEKSQGFTNVGLIKISESVRAYAYLIPSSRASVRSSIV